MVAALSYSIGSPQRRAFRLATLLAIVLAAGVPPARAQFTTNTIASAPTPLLPEPIHWKQDLFLIPYQWSSAAGNTAAVVRLFVSSDRGVAWSAISDAQPHVKAFNYRASGDGEYWFAIRTIDAQGRAWPVGPYQPELRVIVDRSVPKIDALSATLGSGGNLDIRWSASDADLNPASWRIDVQLDATRQTWEAVNLRHAAASPTAAGGQTSWQPPDSRRPVAVRATVADKAGNSTTATVPVAAAPLAMLPHPTTAEPAPPGWSSATLAPGLAASRGPLPDVPTAPATLPWPAQPAPAISYRLYDNTVSVPADGATRYGNPLDARHATESSASTNDRYAARQITPIEPYRQASLRRLPETEEGRDLGAESHPEGTRPGAKSTEQGVRTAEQGAEKPDRKAVNSRTFALEYELADVGRWGVSRVELWGTRNGGQSWRRYAQDDDLQSPVNITVEGEGLYGFCIVAESGGGMPAAPPQAGQAPELWVEVDLHRPFAELTEIRRGAGNQSDQILLRWRTEDDNLLARPVSLFYSSRPSGPWSAIAAELENTGEYAWRVERHVPDRCYLRLEARDAAGNRAAYQTLEPVAIHEAPQDPRPQLIGPADSEAQAPGILQR